jgi:hypothetical protein
MPRNLKNETEFGLPSPMPDPEGNAIPEGAFGPGVTITGLTDAEAIKTGGDADSLSTVGTELRKIYATGDGGLLGPQTPKAGTS